MITEKKRTKISIVEIVALVLIAWLVFSWGYISRTFSMDKYWTLMGAFLPFIYIVVLVGFLGKKGIKIGKEFTLALMFILMLTTAKWYYFSGSAEVNIYNMISGGFVAAIVAPNFPAGSMEYIAELAPSWLLVLDPQASSVIYYGGGDPAWGVFVGPIITWSLLYISVFLISLPMIFFVFGPQWYDVERCQYPITVPAAYTLNETYPTEENGEWGRLLSFRGRNKWFWIAFLIGVIVNLPYLISQVFPATPLGLFAHTYFGCYNIDIYSAVADVLPNAQVNMALGVFVILIIAMFPMDLVLSLLIFRIFTGFIYRPLVTRMGIVPPGIDPGTAWPWPHAVFCNTGGHIGIALFVLWATRHQWMKAFSSFKKDFEVNGMSMRAGMIMMFIGIIMLIGIWTAAGGNLLVTIVWFIIFTLFNLGGAYYYATAMWYGADCSGYQCWQLVFPVGMAMGLFSPTPPQPDPKAAFIEGLATSSSGTCVGFYEGNCVWSQTLMSATYGLARRVGADLKKFVIYITIGFIFMIPFALTLETYVLAHVGLSNVGQYPNDITNWNVIANALDQSVRSVTWSIGALSFTDMWLWTIIGAIFFFAIGWLRTIFPWFFLHPLGVLIGIRNSWWVGWLNIIIGLLIKLVVERALGPRRAIELLEVVLSGFVIGMGCLYLPTGLYLALNISIPNLIALWQ